MKRLPLLLLPLVLLTTACSAPRNQDFSPVDQAAFAPAQEQQLTRALEAKEALFGSLMKALTQALSEGDAADAIAVCRDVAPKLAKEVSTDEGLAIGRTSFKKRNPANTAPAWADDFIEARMKEPAFTAHPDGRLGVLLPITLQQGCIQCHGPEDRIAPEVKAQLQEHYPEDQATGFNEGDLRGWFWIEVPPVG
jgi:hypothetical protein